jgi:transcriptional regulator with XRE-family HTH domain
MASFWQSLFTTGEGRTEVCMQTFMQETVGDRIRRYRIERGISQDQLARQIDRSQAYISDLEQGRASSPVVESVCCVARALNIPVASLLPPEELPPLEDYLRDCYGLIGTQVDFVRQFVEALQAEAHT